MLSYKNKNRIILLALCLTILTSVFAQEKQEGPVKKTLKVGLTLSGGGAKGLAHVGVLKVLEKAGIQIDYITGTSMGGIVGGFYAMGCSADSLDALVRRIPWDVMMNDFVDRRQLSFEEKLIYQKYILTLPFTDFGINLPQGMNEGQNISALLNDFTKYVHSVNDFSKFKIPFKCIAANIETGKADVLDKGFLPEALRATMSIPTVFTPVEIDGNLYVDGGLLDNFPVAENKKMGADIVIGVDLQTPFYKKSQMITSLQILDQASKFLREEANQISTNMCDIIIRPEVTEYSTLGFDRNDEIVALGEAAARKALPKILHLFDSLGIPHNKRIVKELPRIEYVYLDTMIINNASPDLREKILKSYPFNFYHRVEYKKIENLVSHLYGTMNFNKVVYRIDSVNGKQALVIDLKEKNVNDIKLGIHSDTELKTGLLVNYTSNRIFTNKLRFLASALISENPRGNLKLMFNSNGLINPILEVDAMSLKINYYKDFERVSDYRTNSIYGRFSLYSNLSHNFRVGTSVELLANEIKSRTKTDLLKQINQNFYNFNMHFDVDNWNQTYFPTKGVCFSLLGTLINQKKNTSLAMNMRFEPIIHINKRFVVQPKLFSGVLLQGADEDPFWFLYKIGGAHSWKSNQYIPFVGYHLGEVMNYTYAIARTDIQYEIFKNHFVTGKLNLIKHNEDIEELVRYQNSFDWGYGISYAYRSLIGPLELTVSRSNLRKTNLYLCFGFLF